MIAILLALVVGVLGAMAAAWLLLTLGVLYLRHRIDAARSR